MHWVPSFYQRRDNACGLSLWCLQRIIFCCHDSNVASSITGNTACIFLYLLNIIILHHNINIYCSVTLRAKFLLHLYNQCLIICLPVLQTKTNYLACLSRSLNLIWHRWCAYPPPQKTAYTLALFLVLTHGGFGHTASHIKAEPKLAS